MTQGRVSRGPLASVIVDNYNYDQYLDQAIESALSQRYSPLEVIVVDDGSVDDSVAVIERYGDLITPVIKRNGGQGSAFNAGFARSEGELIVFLDADDALLEDAVANAIAAMREGVSKVHWPMWVIDERGERTGGMMDPELPDGDFRELVLRDGPMAEETWPNAATSGNAWARRFLQRAMPMPHVLTGTDIYLSGLAAACGRFVTLAEPQGLYRIHGSNLTSELTFERMIELGGSVFEEQCRALSEIYREGGIDFDPARWRAHAWWPRIKSSLEHLSRLVEPGEAFVLADEDRWGTGELVAGRRRIPFPSRDGVYWGIPECDAELISELDRRRADGVALIVFAWPAFWWLEHYREFTEHLRESYQPVLEDDHIKVFALRPLRA
jgi:glycosyltransferase involved in cell wall biosynthesis